MLHTRASFIFLLACTAIPALAQTQSPPKDTSKPQQPAPQGAKPNTLPAYTQTMPVSRYQLPFLRVPALIKEREGPGRPGKNGEPSEATVVTRHEAIPSFYISTTEVTWDCLDPFVYRLDLENPDAEVDATTRPSKPYIPPDRGFGHEGFPAISVTYRAAEAYCQWLTEKTGLKFRLPTESEWEYAASAGDASKAPTKDTLDTLAWHGGNAQSQTHAAKTKQPNAWGLYDTLGNAGEWVVGRDGQPTLKGGSFKTPADKLSFKLAEKQDASWNASDPQIPKSRWWLPDAPFTGFRLVLEADPKTGEPLKTKPSQPNPSKTNPPNNNPSQK